MVDSMPQKRNVQQLI